MFMMMLNFAMENDIKQQQFLGWIMEFINGYSPECPYAQLCGQQSISKTKVERRVNYMFNSLKEYISRVQITLPNQNGSDSDEVA